MDVIEAIKARHSIRKFTEELVSDEDLLTMLTAATLAPNSTNRQSWHFIAIKSKDVLRQMTEAVLERTEELASFAEGKGMNAEAREIRASVSSLLFFATAPVTVAVCERQDPPDGRGRVLLAQGLSEADIERMRPARMIQSIGAAIENLMLVAVSLGYGTCWMTGPLLAVHQLEEILGIKPPFRLVTLVPIGRPAQSPGPRPRRPLKEVVTVVD